MAGWEVTHHFEKDENNQTTETLTELEIEYSPESNIGANLPNFGCCRVIILNVKV